MRRSLLALALLAASAAVARADYYVSGTVGLNVLEDSDINNNSLDASYDPGFNVSGSLGYEYPVGLRFEGEIGYKRADVTSIGPLSASGEASALSFMGNVIWEFRSLNL